MNRRRFLAAGSALAGSALARTALPRELPTIGPRLGAAVRSGSPELKALAHAALDAARAGGALYADVLFRTTRTEAWHGLGPSVEGSAPSQAFTHGVGIRALVGDCWGVTGMDGAATIDDVVRLGREAAAQAATTEQRGPRGVELAPAPAVADGHWVTPIERDPFTVPADEKLDFLAGMCDYVARLNWDVGRPIATEVRFLKVDTTMASTEGTDYSQTTYTTGGEFSVVARANCLRPDEGHCAADFLTPAGAGWEYVRAAPFREAAMALLEIANRTRGAGERIEFGRYDIVFDAYAMAALLSATVGAATAADRAMGMTVHGVGTSFLSDPLAMLGQLQVAAPNITITANRSTPKGAATVGWDDEGVLPGATRLVQDGVLLDFQTTRESASWLAPYYRRAGWPVRSNGCAGRERATGFPAQCLPNFVLSPGREALTFEDLVRSTKRGYAICGGRPFTDWQALSGVGRADRMYVIRDGKLGSSVNIESARYLFSTPALWKSIVALGGPASARAFGIAPEDAGTAHTVVAVPAQVRQLRFIDPMRGA